MDFESRAIAITSDGFTACVTNQLSASALVIDVNNPKEINETIVGKKPNGIIIKQGHLQYL